MIQTGYQGPPAAIIISALLSANVPSAPEERNVTQAHPLHVSLPLEMKWSAYTIGADLVPLRRSADVNAFQTLRDQWRIERGATSSVTEMAMCRSYLRIIGMGPDVLPLILRQMANEGDEPDLWFVALQMLTGADPVIDDARGNFKEMAKLWLDWASRNGYAW